MHYVVDHLHAPFKDTADDTFLAPHVALAEFPISKKTRELCARAGAARRTVVSIAGTQHEVLTIDTGQWRRRKQLDVIDLVSAEPGNSRLAQRGSHAQSKIHQTIEIFE